MGKSDKTKTIKNMFEIDPSINLKHDLDDLVDIFKIKMISYKDEPQIMWNLYQLANRFLSRYIVMELLETCVEEDMKRHLKLLEVLEKNND